MDDATFIAALQARKAFLKRQIAAIDTLLEWDKTSDHIDQPGGNPEGADAKDSGAAEAVR